MAGKKRKHRHGEALRRFGFVLAVIILLAALAGIYYLHSLQKQAEMERRQEIIDRELSPGVINDGESAETGEAEQEKEKESDKGAEEQDVSKHPEDGQERENSQTEEEGDGNPDSSESAGNEEGDGPDQASDELPPSDQGDAVGVENAAVNDQQDAPIVLENVEDADILDSSVLVLNGSYRNGVAAYWEAQLSGAGFQHLYVGTYAGQAEEKTVIYTQYPEKAQAFLALFPNAEIREGEPSAAFTVSNGNPESRDFIVVIGIADASVSQ